jgi:aryl-alcohol dehydrogenase-like predicted oxidoreductase
MQYTRLGNTGMTVSRLCLGCMTYGGGELPAWTMRRDWAISAEAAREHFALALESGVNFFDTADVYSIGGSEEITGRWLNEMAARDDIVVATKVWGAMAPGPNRVGAQPQAYYRGLREFAATAEDGLHRPLPDSSVGLLDAA